ncbi:DNA-directed RNA polymerase II [Actinoplanes sp. NPDC026670]|uniref:DNA-directed RNA polymerase II n=1 Tax=Actinoplanes sp. NPDC026670 TaxID=3154700 RepID=UPI0033DA4AA4
MPEQPQWSERTLDMPPQDPWADQPTRQTTPEGAATSPVPPNRVPPSQVPPTQAPTSPGPAPEPEPSPFSQGRARVGQPTQRTEQFRAGHEPTGTGWPEEHYRERPQRSLSWHMRQWRRGGEWSSAAVLFAFVGWGIWAISEGGDLGGPLIIFLVSLVVAAGVFALARLVGRLVLEQRMGRQRHTARGAHMVTGLFLAVVGIAFLRQTGWVVDSFNWVADLFR